MTNAQNAIETLLSALIANTTVSNAPTEDHKKIARLIINGLLAEISRSVSESVSVDIINLCDQIKRLVDSIEQKHIEPTPSASKSSPLSALLSQSISTSDKPAAPIEQKPVAPIEAKPAAPIEAKPVAPIEAKPVAPIEAKPVAPIEQKPAASCLADQLEGVVSNKRAAPIEQKPAASCLADQLETMVSNESTAPMVSNDSEIRSCFEAMTTVRRKSIIRSWMIDRGAKSDMLRDPRNITVEKAIELEGTAGEFWNYVASIL